MSDYKVDSSKWYIVNYPVHSAFARDNGSVVEFIATEGSFWRVRYIIGGLSFIINPSYLKPYDL